MTRLEKALAQLHKAMGARQFVLVYDSCHPSVHRSALHMVYGGGFTNTVGMLRWADHYVLNMKHNSVEPREGKEEGK